MVIVESAITNLLRPIFTSEGDCLVPFCSQVNDYSTIAVSTLHEMIHLKCIIAIFAYDIAGSI